MSSESKAAASGAADKRTFSVGVTDGSHRGKVKNTKFTWASFREKLSQPLRDNITLEKFANLSRDAQMARKNRGYVTTTTFEKGQRKKATARKEHPIIMLDFDAIPIEVFRALMKPDETFDVLGPFEYFAHTTRSHSPKSPRVRVAILLSESLPTDAWVATCRLIAVRFDALMNMIDPVCFRMTQVSYLPSVSIGQEFKTFHNATGRVLDPYKDVLELWDGNWKDVRELPRGPRDKTRVTEERAQHPDQKGGWVGAYCRARPIMEHMFHMQELGIYEPAEEGPTPARWSYSLGTSRDGVMVFVEDGRKSSWHGSDPTCDMNIHGFDDLRIHKFGHLDDEEDYDDDTSPSARKSYAAMVDMLRNDPDYADVRDEYMRAEYDREQQKEDAANDEEFSEGLEDDFEVTSVPGALADEADAEAAATIASPTETARAAIAKPTADEAVEPAKTKVDLLALLDMKKDDKNPGPKMTSQNVSLILQHQECFAGVFRFNELTERIVLSRPIISKKLGIRVPRVIQDRVNGTPITDDIPTVCRRIISSPHGKGKPGWGLQVSDTEMAKQIEQIAYANPFHPIKRYFNALEWDGVPRLRKLFPRYFHTRDDVYHEQAGFNLFVAAVARTFEPGHKYDDLAVLEGPQGCGKSTACQIIGVNPSWFGEFNVDLSKGGNKTKEIIENLTGKLIVEWPELSSMTKSEVEPVKAMLSAKSHTARMAYDRYARDSLPSCVMIGTVNPDQYLRDPTGNRRFNPIKIPDGKRIDTKALRRDIHQLWAEAVAYYRSMREIDYPKEEFPELPLFIHGAAETIAKAEQAKRVVTNTEDQDWPGVIREWLDAAIDEEDADLPAAKPGAKLLRNEVCVRMVVFECLFDRSKRYTKVESNLIAKILDETPGWEKAGAHRIPVYGTQKIWRRSL